LDLLSNKGIKTDLKLGVRYEYILTAGFFIPYKSLNFIGFIFVLYIGLNFVFRKPAVIMIVGVNGGGKTTSLGK
jgi:hypothetical protein